MSRMTDERLAEIRKEREGWTCGAFRHSIELLDALEAERAKVAERDSDWVLAMGHAAGLDSGLDVPIIPDPKVVKRFLDAYAEARVAELEQHEKTRTALTASEARVRELEREIERIIAPVESGGGVVAYIRDRAEAAESRLADLLEGLEGLIEVWGGSIGWGTTWQTTRNKCADDLQSLLTKTTPAVNSVDGVNAGENSGGEA